VGKVVVLTDHAGCDEGGEGEGDQHFSGQADEWRDGEHAGSRRQAPKRAASAADNGVDQPEAAGFVHRCASSVPSMIPSGSTTSVRKLPEAMMTARETTIIAPRSNSLGSRRCTRHSITGQVR
jgi:hypothetical protein